MVDDCARTDKLYLLTTVGWFIGPVTTVVISVTERECCIDTPTCVVTLDLVLAACYTYTHIILSHRSVLGQLTGRVW